MDFCVWDTYFHLTDRQSKSCMLFLCRKNICTSTTKKTIFILYFNILFFFFSVIDCYFFILQFQSWKLWKTQKLIAEKRTLKLNKNSNVLNFTLISVKMQIFICQIYQPPKMIMHKNNSKIIISNNFVFSTIISYVHCLFQVHPWEIFKSRLFIHDYSNKSFKMPNKKSFILSFIWFWIFFFVCSRVYIRRLTKLHSKTSMSEKRKKNPKFKLKTARNWISVIRNLLVQKTLR